jgi:hypothetical protein
VRRFLAVVVALGAAGCLPGVAWAGSNPLHENIRALEARAGLKKTTPPAAKPSPKTPARRAPAASPAVVKVQTVNPAAPKPSADAAAKPAVEPTGPPRRSPRRHARRRASPAPQREARAQAAPQPGGVQAEPGGVQGVVSYRAERFGARPKGGDLVVFTRRGDATAHVYVRQQLVSDDGNGHAVVPDLPPGKYPVLVWAPDRGKRKTFWVTIRPGAVAALNATL